jgi:hypothetical protein
MVLKRKADLKEPFSLLLQTKASGISSEPRYKSIKQTKNTPKGEEMSTWLQRLEAICRYFAFEKGAYCPNLRLDERLANKTDE